MKITSQPLVFLDTTDSRKLEVYISSNHPTVQLYNVNNTEGKYTPDWSTTNLKLKADIFLDSEKITPQKKKWYKQSINDTEETLISTGDYTDEITVSTNMTSAIVTYICRVEYQGLTAFEKITFARTDTGLNGTDGKDGTSVRILGTATAKKSTAKPGYYEITYNSGAVTAAALGDAYINESTDDLNGHLFVCAILNDNATGNDYFLDVGNIQGPAGKDGDDAKSITLTSSAQVFKVDKDQSISPSQISVTAQLINIQDSQISWSYNLNDGKGWHTTLSGVSVSGKTVNVSKSALTTESLAIKASYESYSDIFTIYKVYDGIKGDAASMAFLTNENISFAANASGQVALTTLTTNVVAYSGTEKVMPTVGTPSGVPNGMIISVDSASLSGSSKEAILTISVANNSNLGSASSNHGTVTIPITSPVSTNLLLSWSKINAGPKGEEGAGVRNIEVMYGVTNSSSTRPGDEDWEENISDLIIAEGSYLWTRTIIDYTDDRDDTVAYTYVKQGSKGETGTSLEKVEIEYTASSNSTTPPSSGWSPAIQLTTSEKPYLWTKTIFKLENGDESYAYSVAKQGRGIDHITEYYLATSASSNVTTSTSGWKDTIQTVTSDNKYLWNYETITYTDGASSSTAPTIIGVYGNTGATGPQGNGISSIEEWYLATSASSGVTTSTSGWKNTVQSLTATNKYLWNYEIINYTNGSRVPTAPVIIGVYGDKGDKGDKGDAGAQGIQGIQGPKGDQGIQGQKGDNGQTSYFHIKYSANADGNPMSDVPSTYIGTYVDYTSDDSDDYTKYTWSRFVGAQGAKGDQGIAGKNGENGRTSYLHIKYSNVSNPTTSSQINDDGGDYIGQYTDFESNDSTDPSKYTWVKIKGEQGAQGIQGIQGERGEQGIQGKSGTDGKTSYFHIKYSSNSNGNPMTETPSTYIGTYVDYTEADSSDYTKYTWSRFIGAQGERGDQGIAGTNGEDGLTSYLHIAYSTSSDGKTGFSVSDASGKTYIGQYTDHAQSDSTDPTKYKWTLIKGDKGDKGDQGYDGVGIASTTVTYGVSDSSSTQPTSWQNTIPTVAEGKYLWTRTVIDYTDTARADTVSYTYAKQGTKGETGSAGSSVTVTSIQYQEGTSATTAPTGTWSNSVVSVADGKYLWTKIVFSDGKTSYAVAKQGSSGRGVSSIAEEYYQSTSATSQSGGSWSTTVPTWADGKYIWTRSVITYTDSTTYTTTPVCVTGQKGATGGTGSTGATGVGVSSVDVWYYQSTSSTSLSGGSWSTTAPTWADGKYVWTKTITTYTDSTTDETAAVCITGQKGATGVGVKSVTEYYLATASSSGVTSSTSGWTTTIQTITSDKKYLWNYEVIAYTDDTTSSTAPVIIGAFGNTGGTGATGKGIKSVTEYYLASTATTGVTTSTTGWTTTMQTLTATNKYLWNYELLTYTDNSTATINPVIIGVYGDKGDKGSTGDRGAGINSVTVTYGTSTAATTQPATWQSTLPTVAEGSYLWTRTVTDYTDASIEDTVTLTYAKQGSKGSTGTAGTSVTVSSIQYQAGTSATTAPTGAWSDTVVTVSAGSYLWTKTTFSDGKIAYGVARQGSDGAKGATGSAGADAYTVLLTNESHVFAGDVSNALASTATTQVLAYKGTTAQTVTIVSINGVTAATASTATGIAGLSFACSALSGTTPTITFTCTTSFVSQSGSIPIVLSVGGVSITKMFTYSIAFKGSTGATGGTGSAGAAATAYWLISDASVVQKSNSGSVVLTPSTLTFTGKSKTGTSAPADYACRWIIAYSTDGSTYTNSYTSSVNEASKTFTVDSSYKSIRVRMYLAGGTSTLLDEQIIPVVTDGAIGTPGMDAVTFQIYSSSGYALSTNTPNVTLQTFAYVGDVAITAGATYQWYKYSTSGWSAISGATNAYLAISRDDVAFSQSYMCKMTFNGVEYTSVATIDDKNDNNKVFTTKPSNYAAGDIWIVGSDYAPSGIEVGTLLKAQYTNTSYADADWIKATKYDDQLKDIQDDLTQYNQYFSFSSADGVKITAKDSNGVESKYSTTISNDEWAINYGAEAVTYVNGTKMHIKEAEIEAPLSVTGKYSGSTMLQAPIINLGNFSLVIESNGSLSIVVKS